MSQKEEIKEQQITQEDKAREEANQKVIVREKRMEDRINERHLKKEKIKKQIKLKENRERRTKATK